MRPKGFMWRLLVAASLIVAASISTAASGDRAAQANSPASPTVETLVDHFGQPGANFVSSQNFAFDLFDARAADDFVIEQPGSWFITAALLGGEYYQISGDADRTVESVNVQIYANANGKPGAMLFQTTAVPTAGLSTGEFLVSLNPSLVLAGNVRYWVSAQANKVSTNGQWMWRERSGAAAGFESVWQNPGNVGNHGCVAYNYRVTVCGRGTDHDLRFRLDGFEFQVTDSIYLPIIRR